MVVLSEHHDHEIGIEAIDDLAHGERPIEVVRACEARGDAALTRHLDEPRAEHAFGVVAQSRCERVSDDRHAELPALGRRADGIVGGPAVRSVRAAVPAIGILVRVFRGDRDVLGWRNERAARLARVSPDGALDRVGELVDPDPIAHCGERPEQCERHRAPGPERRGLGGPLHRRCVQHRPHEEGHEDDDEDPSRRHQPASVERSP